MPYRLSQREAGWQLPSSLDALIPATHSVRFVAAYVDRLTAADWTRLGISLESKDRGAPRYHPRILLCIWLWGFMNGVRSARKLEAACAEMLSYRWLTGQQTPDHNTLWRFYQANRVGMRSLLRHSVQVAVQAGLVDLAVQAIDGTKIAANAAKDRTYDHKGLERLHARLEAAIADLEAQNTTGGDGAPPRLPEALSSTAALAERVRQAHAELAPGERINLSDADAQLMKGRGGILAGYNAQAAVSPLQAAVAGTTGMLVTAAEVTDDPDDHSQLVGMLEQAAATTGERAGITLADGGYHSGENLAAAADWHLAMPESQAGLEAPYHKDRFHYDPEQDAYQCPEGKLLSYRRTTADGHRIYRGTGAVCRACPAFGVCTTNGRQGRSLEVSRYEAELRAHRTWMATAEAKARYAQRKELIEPVFGIVKEQQGARRFLLRGLEQVRSEWQLVAAAFNLRTLARVWQQRPLVVLAALQAA